MSQNETRRKGEIETDSERVEISQYNNSSGAVRNFNHKVNHDV